METEELKEMKPVKFGFYYGSIFGGIAFVYHLLAQYLGFNTTFFYGLMYSFLVLFANLWVCKKYISLKDDSNGESFSTLFKIGTIFSLTISFFYLVFTFAKIEFIDVNFMNTLIELYEELIAQMNMPEMSLEGDVSKSLYITFLVTNFIGDFLGNMFYALCISFIFKNRKF